MSKKVYKLDWDYGHSGDTERDAFHISFKGDDKVMYYFSSPEIYGSELLPSEILFQANFRLIPSYDYPLTDLQIPIISRQMYDVLKRIGLTDHLVVPVIMIDDSYLGDRFQSEGFLSPDVPTNNDYLALRLSSLQSYFDSEKSDYRPLRSNPKAPGRIKKLVLKEPLGGFSALFRVDVISSSLFISQSAKEALEAAGIKGCVFEEVEVS